MVSQVRQSGRGGKLDADFAYWERDQMQSEGGDLDADFACGESGREFAKKVQNGGFLDADPACGESGRGRVLGGRGALLDVLNYGRYNAGVRSVKSKAYLGANLTKLLKATTIPAKG